MLSAQIKINHSIYSELYDLVFQEDHILRRIHDLVDFSFIYEELESKYCLDNGREAKSPILLFKYLLLKYLYNLSDKGVVERSKYDLSFKFFLDLAPEDKVINPSLLTKFRTQRLKDAKLLDLLINKSVEIAISEGVIKSKAIIVDSTHTDARYHKATRYEMLKCESSALRASLKEAANDMALPEEPDKHASFEKLQDYCAELVTTVNKSPYAEVPDVKEETSLLEEMLNDKVDSFSQSIDKDARIGYKAEGRSFYGYKTHLAMTEDRIITAATITSGEAFDGKELPSLVEKSRTAGIPVDEVIADTAYSTLDNLKDAKARGYKLISKLNPKGCYKENAKSKTYSVTVKSDYHVEQKAFQESDYFKMRVKERYKIEAKNSELKGVHGYDQCDSAGLACIQIQGAVTIFAANLKRTIRLKGEECPN